MPGHFAAVTTAESTPSSTAITGVAAAMNALPLPRTSPHVCGT